MPSAANASRRRLERLRALTFFLDHQIGRYVVAELLRAAGATVEVHLDHFNGDAPDTDWIPEVARRNWVLITKDKNIRRNPLERAAYVSAGLRGFVATGQDMSGVDLGDLLVRRLDGMLRRAYNRGKAFLTAMPGNS